MVVLPQRHRACSLAWLALIAVVGASQQGCGHWRTARIEDEPDVAAAGSTLRLRLGGDRRTVRVVRLQFPRIEAVEEDAPQGPGIVVLDLTTFDEVEVYSFQRGVALTSLAIVGTVAAAGAVASGVFVAYCSQTRCFGD